MYQEPYPVPVARYHGRQLKLKTGSIPVFRHVKEDTLMGAETRKWRRHKQDKGVRRIEIRIFFLE